MDKLPKRIKQIKSNINKSIAKYEKRIKDLDSKAEKKRIVYDKLENEIDTLDAEIEELALSKDILRDIVNNIKNPHIESWRMSDVIEAVREAETVDIDNDNKDAIIDFLKSANPDNKCDKCGK